MYNIYSRNDQFHIQSHYFFTIIPDVSVIFFFPPHFLKIRCLEHETVASMAATSSLQMKEFFFFKWVSTLAAFLLCLTSKWILGAVCRCHNNKVPAGQFVCKWQWACPDIPAYTTRPSYHGNAQLLLEWFFSFSTFSGGKTHSTTQWHHRRC